MSSNISYFFLYVMLYLILLVFRGPQWKKLERYALAADSIRLGDIVSSKIRSTNNWSLLPAQVFIFYLQ